MRIRISAGLALAAVLAVGAVREAVATDGHFLHGVGAINASLGGAGVAAPRDLLGTLYLNPAGLMAFEGPRVDLGFEMFRPDRTVSSTAGPASGATASQTGFTPIPAFAWSTRLNNDRVVVGLGALGAGGFGVDYPTSTTNPILAPSPNGFGQVYSNYNLLKVVPAVAIAATSRLWLGFAANVDWASLAVTPMPIGAPAVSPGPDGVYGTADDEAYYSSAGAASNVFGLGFQAGALFKASDVLSLGAAFTSPQYFQKFTFNTVYANPDLPNYGAPRTISFRMNVPAVIAGGIAVTPRSDLSFAGDVRYITYANTAGFDKRGYAGDGSVKGFGWQNIWVVAVGAEFRASDRLAVRTGYNHSGNPIPDSLSMFNVPAPAVVQNHVTLGLGIQATHTLGVDVAYYHAFRNSINGPLCTPAGALAGTSVTSELSEDSFLLQFTLSPTARF